MSVHSRDDAFSSRSESALAGTARPNHAAVLEELQRASRAIGMEVKNYRDERLGIVSDLAIDLESARLVFVFTSNGGLLRIASKAKAIPPSALLQHTDGKTLVLGVEKAHLEAAPTVPPPHWLREVDPGAIEEIYQHYELPRYGEFPGERIRLVGASDLIGTKVRNGQGESLGTLRDLVLDLVHGRVAYAVLRVEDSDSGMDKLVAIPPNALMPDPTSKVLIFNTDKDRMARAPGFMDDAWPDFANSLWGADVYRYHGREPYWESREFQDAALQKRKSPRGARSNQFKPTTRY